MHVDTGRAFNWQVVGNHYTSMYKGQNEKPRNTHQILIGEHARQSQPRRALTYEYSVWKGSVAIQTFLMKKE